MKARVYIFLSSLILLSSYACSGSSEADMKQASEAMKRAKSLHADTYAPSDFEKAQTAWDHAQAAEKDGKTGGAKVLFTSAKIFFGKAADIAKAKQDALSRELSGMQLMIENNFDQVKSDLSSKNLSLKQRHQVEVIAAEVEKDKVSIGKLVSQEDLPKAVEMAKAVQTKIYHAQLILAGQSIK